MDDLQLEILSQVKDLAVSQATLAAKLDSYLEYQTKLEEKLNVVVHDNKKISKHDFIIKGILWMYGLLVSAYVYAFFSNRFHS